MRYKQVKRSESDQKSATYFDKIRFTYTDTSPREQGGVITLKILLAIGASADWEICKIDVAEAFLTTLILSVEYYQYF